MKPRPQPFLLVALLAVALVGTLAGCDGLTASEAEDGAALAAEAPELAAMADVLTQELALTPAQRTDVEDALYHHRGRRHEAGFLWTVARELQTRLTAEQKEQLFARAAEAEAQGGFFGLGLGAGFGPGGMGPGPFGGGPFGEGGYGPGMHRPGFGGVAPGWGDGAWGPWNGAGSLLEEVLTEEQLAALEEIRAAFRADLAALMQDFRDGALTREAFRDQWIALREQMQAAVEQQITLTEEQQAALDALREERRERHREQMQEHFAEMRAAMQEALGLTGDQVAAVEALLDDLRAQLDALIDAGDVTPEALADLQDQFREGLAGILGETQLEIYDIHHALRLLGPMHGGWRSGYGNGNPGSGGRWGGPGGGMHGGQGGGPGGGMHGGQGGGPGGGMGGGWR